MASLTKRISVIVFFPNLRKALILCNSCPVITVRPNCPRHRLTLASKLPTSPGKDTIEIQKDILEKGQRVIICDDLLATGGTAKAAGKLIEKVGGEITGFAFIIELTELNGIKGLSKYNCKSLVKY